MTQADIESRPTHLSLARIDRLNARLILGLGGVVGALVLWEIGSRLGLIRELFFSKPSDIFLAGLTALTQPRFWSDLGISSYELIVGFALAVIVAVPLGLVAGYWRRLRYSLDPPINFLNALPQIALLPIIVIWVGLGTEAKIATVFIGVVFPVLIPTMEGVKSVDPGFLNVGRSLGASRWRTFTSIVAPATLPYTMAGIRLGFAGALTGLVTAELFAATHGLGVMIARASQTLQSDRMLFGVLIFTAAGVLGSEGIRLIEKRFGTWRSTPAL